MLICIKIHHTQGFCTRLPGGCPITVTSRLEGHAEWMSPGGICCSLSAIGDMEAALPWGHRQAWLRLSRHKLACPSRARTVGRRNDTSEVRRLQRFPHRVYHMQLCFVLSSDLK